MADVNRDRFLERVNALKYKANPNTRVEKRVTDDGLVITVAKSNKQSRSLLPVRGIAISAVLFVAVKGFLFAEIGEAEYLSRLDEMKKGGAIQVSAAFVLDADPATRVIGGFLNRTIR